MPWFACATRRPISCNTGGTLSPNRGLILHHAVGNGSLFAVFNNPARQASTHFWVAQSGAIEQYVDTGVVAWGNGNSQANAQYCSVETEGCGSPPHADPMSEAMVAALGRLYAEGARVHGWANALAGAVGQPGFGFHRMASATACPCDVRLNRRQEILNRAFGGAPAPAPPAPSPAPPAPSPGGAPPFPGRILRRGVKGADVAQYQARMIARGWGALVAAGGADGDFGPTTESVTRQFQAEKRLAVDGEVGPQTWAAAWTAPVT